MDRADLHLSNPGDEMKPLFVSGDQIAILEIGLQLSLHLIRGFVGKGDHGYPIKQIQQTACAMMSNKADTGYHGEGLSRACTGSDQDVAVNWGVFHLILLVVKATDLTELHQIVMEMLLNSIRHLEGIAVSRSVHRRNGAVEAGEVVAKRCDSRVMHLESFIADTQIATVTVEALFIKHLVDGCCDLL